MIYLNLIQLFRYKSDLYVLRVFPDLKKYNLIQFFFKRWISIDINASECLNACMCIVHSRDLELEFPDSF